jgi:DNA modification methylase
MNKIINADVIEGLKQFPDGIADMCVTSPPYFGLRSYLNDDDPSKGIEVGLEKTPQEYVQKMVEVFREVRRVLRDDGTLWLNIGDSYVSSATGSLSKTSGFTSRTQNAALKRPSKTGFGLPEKNLIGIPWRLAFALQDDGWTLRQDIIFSKRNPMPESVTDRCVKSHEYVFLLSKKAKYYFDHKAIKEPSTNIGKTKIRFGGSKYGDSDDPKHATKSGNEYVDTGMRNKRSVWTISLKPYSGAHFATFPPDLIEPMILAGSPKDGIVLDPFMGSGTTAGVAVKLGRQYIGTELNPEYCKLHEERIESIVGSKDKKPKHLFVL